MRTVMMTLGLATLTAGPLLAADTPLASQTRTKLLKAKITIDVKEEMFHVILDDIKAQVREQGLPALGIKIPSTVSRNQRLTIAADGKPLDEVLDEMLTINKLGYIVVSKQGDRYDGWLEITMGDERGYLPGEEPKPGEDAPPPAEEVTPSPMPMEVHGSEPPMERVVRDKEEMLARISNQHLELAITYLDANRPDKARAKLEFIIRVDGATPAGKAAEELLEELQ